MYKSKALKTISFFREGPSGRESCLVEVFHDGSVYIDGPDDVNGGFEECSDAEAKAIRLVESKGFVRSSEQ
jgi:hypothetical protein